VKPRPVDDATLERLAREHGTPLYVVCAETIVERARELFDARADGRRFDVVRYAQKANPNLSIVRLLTGLGCALDAVSAGEMRRALAAGVDARTVTFCSDVIDDHAAELLARHPFQLNAGTPQMLEQYAALRPPRRDVVLRVNPGFGHGHDAKVTTGGAASKHGIWHGDLEQVVARAAALELAVVGLHMHIGSGSDREHLARVGPALGRAAEAAGPELRSLSAGGGLPVPYREGEARLDVRGLLADLDRARRSVEARLGHPLALELEPGRYLVAESGLLLCRVRATKRSDELAFTLVDAGFHNLVRPAMYGAYHALSIVGRDGEPREPQVVAGPLCESADVFTQGKHGRVEPRDLPQARVGDLLCIHDAGAYGSSMASGYNTQLLAAEVMLHNGRARLVRPRQTFEALLAPEIDCLE
jgi:diaminopimelate decarboxylase